MKLSSAPLLPLLLYAYVSSSLEVVDDCPLFLFKGKVRWEDCNKFKVILGYIVKPHLPTPLPQRKEREKERRGGMGIQMYSRVGVWEDRTMEGPREEATGPLKM